MPQGGRAGAGTANANAGTKGKKSGPARGAGWEERSEPEGASNAICQRFFAIFPGNATNWIHTHSLRRGQGGGEGEGPSGKEELCCGGLETSARGAAEELWRGSSHHRFVIHRQRQEIENFIHSARTPQLPSFPASFSILAHSPTPRSLPHLAAKTLIAAKRKRKCTFHPISALARSINAPSDQ